MGNSLVSLVGVTSKMEQRKSLRQLRYIQLLLLVRKQSNKWTELTMKCVAWTENFIWVTFCPINSEPNWSILSP